MVFCAADTNFLYFPNDPCSLFDVRDYDMILILILIFDCFRSEGFYVAYTAAEKPFALGNWTGESYKQRSSNNSSATKVPIVTDNNSTDRDILKQLIPKVKLQ